MTRVLEERLGRLPAAHRAARAAASSLLAELSAVAVDRLRALMAMEVGGEHGWGEGWLETSCFRVMLCLAGDGWWVRQAAIYMPQASWTCSTPDQPLYRS